METQDTRGRLLSKYADRVGSRKEPLCMIFHKDYGWVPIIQIDEAVVWDDNQISRTIPPSEIYEIDEWDEFDLAKPVFETKD